MPDTEFWTINSLIKPYTMLDDPRLKGLYDAVVRVVEQDVPGDIIECGAAHGGSAALMGLTLKALGSDRTLWVCDTFNGIPAATADDPESAMQYTGQFKGELQDLEELFNKLGIDNVKFIKGLFQDTLPTLEIGAIAVCHLDGDWYESTKCGLECLYDKVSPGGVVQIDDYGHWAGCQKAVDEFFSNRNISVNLEYLDYTGRQFIKECA